MIDANRDTETQLVALAAASEGLAGVRVQFPDAADWLAAMSPLLSQAIAEGEDGAVHGMDSAREAFFTLADRLAEIAALTWLRTLPLANMDTVMPLHTAWTYHRGIWHAIRALRQTLYWTAGGGDLTARLPMLSLTVAGKAMADRLSVDPLPEATRLTRAEAADLLNNLARGLAWQCHISIKTALASLLLQYVDFSIDFCVI
jgi:hypothetical protein